MGTVVVDGGSASDVLSPTMTDLIEAVTAYSGQVAAVLLQTQQAAQSAAEYAAIADGAAGVTTVAVATLNAAIALKQARGATTVSDANYTIVPADSKVAYITLTAARTLTLPGATAYPPGQTLWILDETGDCSATDTVTIVPAGSDTIAGGTSVIMSNPYQKLAFHSNGSNLWTYS